MELFEAIKTRRSIPLVKDEPVPKEMIEKILDAGTYAPNYHRTNPWRFFVFTGQGRDTLGRVFADAEQQNLSSEELEKIQARIERLKKSPLRAPVIITVAMEPSQKKKVIEQEEIAAVHSCIQNMLLAAHALGLGAIWRTGSICYNSSVREFFDLGENSQLVGFIYIGYPDFDPPTVTKTNYMEFTTWIE